MINITFTSDPLPTNFSGSLDDFRRRFLTNLRGTIADSNVIYGRINGSMPNANIGPWLNFDTWYVWNGTTYVISPVRVGNLTYNITLVPALVTGTAQTQTVQDKTGTIALLSDVYVGRSTIQLTGTAPVIDWSTGHSFFQLLSGNTTYTIKNMSDGQTIRIAARNSGTSWTIAWPSSIFWVGGIVPTQSASKTDIYILYNFNGSILGRQIAGY